MDQDTQTRLPFTSISGKKVEADFDGGNVTSDGGALFLREVEKEVGVIGRFVGVLRDGRDQRYVDHSLEDLLRQRIFQIALGYEDANDSDDLRKDPGLKAACERMPISGADLGSQATMTRLENGIHHKEKQGISRTDLYRMGRALVDTFIASYEAPPGAIILDMDDTDDPVHGAQQLSLFNGYYGEHCYLPLHIYEGQSGKLITTILRPGCRPTGIEITTILKHLVRYVRKSWPEVVIFIRADGHFSAPEVHDYCEAEKGVYYVLGQTGNSVLKGEALPVLLQARALYQAKQDKQERVQLFTEFFYQADTWSKPRRMIAKVEVSEKGDNLRFVVTNFESSQPSFIYHTVYCARGRMENFIKDHKTFLHSDRTSCHTFGANQFRLFLHSAAYVLLHALSEKGLSKTQWENVQFNTLQNRILKIGAKVRELKTKILFHFPTSFPLKDVFRKILFNLKVAYS